MKKLLLFTVALFFVQFVKVKAQTQNQSKLIRTIAKEKLAEYCCHKDSCETDSCKSFSCITHSCQTHNCESPDCKSRSCKPYSCKHVVQAAHEDAFDLLIKPILSNVLTGGDELATSTSAASFVQDKDKGTININATHAITLNHYINIGAFATSKDGLFGIYTDNSWNTNIGLNIGYSYATSTKNFKAKDCEKIKSKREKYVDSLLFYYDSLIYTAPTNLDSVIKETEESVTRLKRIAERHNNDAEAAYYLTCIQEINKAQEKLGTLLLLRKKYSILSYNTDTLARKLIDSVLITYDTIHTKDIFTGYGVQWHNISVAISNNSIKLDNSKLSEALKNTLSPNNQLAISLIYSYNRTRNSPKTLHYYKGSLSPGLTNILSHPQYTQSPLVTYDSTASVYQAAKSDGTFIKNYNDIKPNIGYIEIGGYGAIFFLLKKSLGMDISASVKYSTNQTDYPYLHTIAGGPIFLINAKDGYSKGTVGIQCGLVNATDLRQDISKYFGVTLKVGLPFSAFTGSSSKKE